MRNKQSLGIVEAPGSWDHSVNSKGRAGGDVQGSGLRDQILFSPNSLPAFAQNLDSEAVHVRPLVWEKGMDWLRRFWANN